MTLEHTLEERRRKEKYDELRHKEEEAATERLASKMELPYANLTGYAVNAEALSVLDESATEHAGLCVISKNGPHLKIAIKNPKNPQTMLAIENLKNKGFVVDLALVSEGSLKRAWEFYSLIPKEKEGISGTIEITPENLVKLQEEIKYIDDFKDIYMRASLRNVTAVIELIIAGSLSLNSSDIHIEPQKEKAVIRFRIDGALQEIAELNKQMYELLTSRVKLLSKMKINVKNTPQDGRFTITSTGSIPIEVRTSVLPGPEGESIVMRILNPKAIALALEDLGVLNHDLELIKEELKRPNGLILVTGPTGSGKTTTLYAFLKKIKNPEIKIITIEDPIEYHVEGISQSQVNQENHYTFSSGLRSILRQDPDIILVGEIRDMETADIALHAALTGHLVFSTLHTNDAPSSILRLIDMKLSPSIIAPALNMLIAQRLVRKVCKQCAKKDKITEEELKKIRTELADLPLKIKINLPEISENIEIARATGCKECNYTGFKGRIGVYEMFPVNNESEKVIVSKPTQAQLFEMAKRNGMVTMKQDGFIKVLNGITTVSEVESVTG